MTEVTGPIIATALVLCAVFVPTAFISGLTASFTSNRNHHRHLDGDLRFNSLTLSPALSALLLKDHHAPKDFLARGMDFAFGWFFRPFNRIFAWAGHKYSGGVRRVIRFSAIALILYAGLVAPHRLRVQLCPLRFRADPGQAIPHLIRAIARRRFAQPHRGGDPAHDRHRPQAAGRGIRVAFPGMSISGFSVAPNAGIVFFTLKPFEERKTPDLSGLSIAKALNQKLAVIQEAFVMTVPAPPVNGLGTIGGFKSYIEDRSDRGYDAIYTSIQDITGKGRQTPGLDGLFSTFTVNVPQLDANIDRVKAKTEGVPLQIFSRRCRSISARST